VKTAALITAVLIALFVVLVAAIRGLRKFVRSVWPHS
jgi:hypothetical protein